MKPVRRPGANGTAALERRLTAQQIARHTFQTPAELVACLGAVQAQDYAAAKWAVGLRLARADVTDGVIERAIADGTVLRTHMLRGTWQLVAPADIHWMLALVAPRLIARNARRYRELDLDARTFRRSNAAFAKVLGSGEHRTRAELSAALIDAGIGTSGQRLAYLLQRAELDGILCSGARRGKRSTYALTRVRAPQARTHLERSQALAQLARRYFQSRGPATVNDFAWWSGLAASEARGALESIQSTLVSDVIDGETYWHTGEAPAVAPSPTAHLLPPFDEYLVAYRDRSGAIDPKHAKRVNAGGGILGPCVVLDGRVIGTWRRALARHTVAIEIELFGTLTRTEERAMAEAAQRYGAFLGLETRVASKTHRKSLARG
jgi:hypothetical protein